MSSPTTAEVNTTQQCAPTFFTLVYRDTYDATTAPTAIAQVQVVTTLAQCRKVLHWMLKTEQVRGDVNLMSKVVDQFPSIVKSKTRKSNITKAVDWWMKRSKFLEASRGSTVASTRLKFDAPLLRQVALRQFQVPGAAYDTASVDAQGVPLSTRVTLRWVQVFMEKHMIVLRAHTGKRQVSHDKQAQIEREVASHLGQLKRDFESGKLDENTVENVDETISLSNLTMEIILKYPLEFASKDAETADEQESINEEENEDICRIERAETHILDEVIV
ncbi:hypothetical protein ON010_g17890 [Phytophthora cinnamomi]|nr:hypothetical protein ON010_g17890 [Phytophthora cinnamomi]